MNEKINTGSFLSVERIRRQIERYTNQMKENLAAGGNRAVMAVKGSPVVVTDMSEENRKKLTRGVNRWSVLISDEAEKSFRKMLGLYMDLEELMEELSDHRDAKAEVLEEICSRHPVTLLWPGYAADLLEWTGALSEEHRNVVHKLLIDEMNTRTIDCLMTAKNRGEIDIEDFTSR